MIFLGLDPGTSDNMAIAALLPDGDFPIRVQLTECGWERDARDRAVSTHARVKQALLALCLPSGPAVMALEWQRPLPTDKNPKNISDLSAFAGIALATVQSIRVWDLDVLTPLPEDWKGQVPKHVKHNRIVAAAGEQRVRAALSLGLIPIPPLLGHFTKEFTGMAGNALDAIGLALWARDRAKLQAMIRSARLTG